MARMLEASKRTANGLPGWVAWLLVATVACTSTTRHSPAPPTLAAWHDALHDVDALPPQTIPDAGQSLPLRPDSGLLLVDPSWRPPEHGVDEAQRRQLLQWVQAGGHLVLFGHAAHLVNDLGLESERPERTTFRWGYDARTAIGRARLGLTVVSGRLPELFAGTSGEQGEQVLLLTGGQPCTLPLCSWAIGLPRNGEVVARLCEETDGMRAPVGAPALVYYACGRGAVLACGLVPAVDHEDPELRSTAREFVRRCAIWAGGEHVVVLTMPWRGPGESASAELPAGAPLLPHWGWQVAGPAESGSRSAAEVLADVLLPSWAAGADSIELQLTNELGETVQPWPPGDPLRPAPSWRGPRDGAGWPRGDIARIAAEAHSRGLLAYGDLDPLPVGDAIPERLVALRYLARELADFRRLGDGALDGLALREWFTDRAAYAVSMLQDFQPAASLQRRGERAPEMAGAIRALDAADGSPRGLRLAGISEPWRNGFPADMFPCGVLDARARAHADDHFGGGSADWLVTQANDFVRARRGQGGAIVWRRFEPRSFADDTLEVVHGVSLEPLRAAVAMPLAATGRNGVRAAAASLLAEAPPGFGSETDAPAAVHVLQNNHLRLLGSGGPLQLDPAGLARFRDREPLLLSPSFLRTRLSGGRPEAAIVQAARVDFLANGQAGEGGHGRVSRVGTANPQARPPAVLAGQEQPHWPAAVWCEWQATGGYHELELVARGIRDRGVLTVSLDGVLLQAVPFQTGQPAATLTIPVHSARIGLRQLQLEVVDGGAVAIDRLLLRRAGDVGVEAHVQVAAGSRAVLVERSWSSQHQERLELITQADFAGLVLRCHCERAVRNLQIDRSFVLPELTTLAATSGDEDGEALRQPFVLRGGADRPDLVVVPLLLARHDSLRWRSGTLLLHQAPEAGMQARLGFLFCAHGDGERLLAHAATLLLALDEPTAVDLGDSGEARLRSDLPLAWSRVVQISGDPRTPFAVCEGGFWQWRGSQLAPSGDRWLRIHQAPGDTVQIVAGPTLLARTRPGPGSLRLLALKEPTASSVIVRVLQPSRLCAPSVVMAADFDTVTVDGEPWAWFDGRTVFLPDRIGTSLVRTQSLGGARAPHVRATRAPLSICRYIPERRELLLATAGTSERPAEVPWTAVLMGPVPVRIDNGEVVADPSLRIADAEQLAAVRAGGVLVRFRSGITKVHYGN